MFWFWNFTYKPSTWRIRISLIAKSLLSYRLCGFCTYICTYMLGRLTVYMCHIGLCVRHKYFEQCALRYRVVLSVYNRDRNRIWTLVHGSTMIGIWTFVHVIHARWSGHSADQYTCTDWLSGRTMYYYKSGNSWEFFSWRTSWRVPILVTKTPKLN